MRIGNSTNECEEDIGAQGTTTTSVAYIAFQEAALAQGIDRYWSFVNSSWSFLPYQVLLGLLMVCFVFDLNDYTLLIIFHWTSFFPSASTYQPGEKMNVLKECLNPISILGNGKRIWLDEVEAFEAFEGWWVEEDPSSEERTREKKKGDQVRIWYIFAPFVAL